MALTEEQRRAITESGNIIVSAAAGAGKTMVLTERVFRLVTEGTSIDRLLILTFTHAAADEMKTRIAQRLSDAAATESDPRRRRYFRAQAQLCASANISTIHAFCAKVVFRHFFCVGLTPSSKTLDKTESDVLRREARETLLVIRDSFGNSLIPFLARHFDIVAVDVNTSPRLEALVEEYSPFAVLTVVNGENVIKLIL